ncbi:MAG: hypothetical protein RTV41_09505 [Candidatus Thorarchaeota archaeon]
MQFEDYFPLIVAAAVAIILYMIWFYCLDYGKEKEPKERKKKEKKSKYPDFEMDLGRNRL